MVKSFLRECPVLLRERLGIRFELAHLNSISQEEEPCVERLERRKSIRMGVLHQTCDPLTHLIFPNYFTGVSTRFGLRLYSMIMCLSNPRHDSMMMWSC
jgi:hypothetical protein